MGNGGWSTRSYNAASTYRKVNKVADFAYSASGARQVHTQLDPGKFGAAGVRESRDSTEHPLSTAIMVLIDVTGSMAHVPALLQKKLPDLYDLLLSKGYVTDPQILFGAIGDAYYDRAPLQIAQFESDNRADEQLRNILLEGGGGGGMRESYELAMYFAARKTSIDCLENRDHKGYLFMIGDEMPYETISRDQVRQLIGDDLSSDVPLREIVDELTEMYDVYYIMPSGASHAGSSEVLNTWRDLLGQNVLQLDDLSKTCEVIGTTIDQAEQAFAASHAVQASAAAVDVGTDTGTDTDTDTDTADDTD